MEPKQSKENALFEWYDSLVFALAVIVLFFVFAVRIITVSGVSMQPTLYGGDRVAVQSMLYTPQRGDVVVVDGYINYGDPLVKRLIGRRVIGSNNKNRIFKPGHPGSFFKEIPQSIVRISYTLVDRQMPFRKFSLILFRHSERVV